MEGGNGVSPRRSSCDPSSPSPSLPPSLPQALLQFVERMQEQIAEKKESMRILKERMAEAAQAAEEAKASVQKEWGKLLEGGWEEGVEEGGRKG